tara:strand:+ start:461 stop:676 length:216 start_codon:yes stop_codon:yes gene_type:complete
MISGIRIYDKNGILKKEISSKKAVDLFNENNKKEWSLSSTQRKTWEGFKSKNNGSYKYKKISISSKRGPGC